MSSGASRPYRSKTVKPCDACRRRRIACIRDNANGVCSLCRHRGHTCTFESLPPTRRARQAKARAATLGSRVDRPVEELADAPSLDETAQVPQVCDAGGDENELSSASRDWFNGTTMFTNKTCLYSGASSDQDPHLLRHLVYDETECFGDDSWTVWRIGKDHGVSSYLTVFPNSHLDCSTNVYSLTEIESMVAPYQDELIRLYYAYVHPSYPILESQESIQSRLKEKQIPGSLIALVYKHGAHFWRHSPLAGSVPCPLPQEIRPWVFSRLSLEIRTPNLATVQALLLFMQLIPGRIRAPNHPGFWPLTNVLVGVAQEIGLHVDPKGWGIALSERKLRRILWWAVLSHDKWMAHSLGRPSHIASNSWNVAHLTLSDFADDSGRLPVESLSSVSAFIAFCDLGSILAAVLDAFYSIRVEYDARSPVQALERAQPLLSRLQRWREDHSVSTNPGHPHQYVVRLTALTVRLSIQRAVFGALSKQRSERATSLAAEVVSTVREDLFAVFEALERSRPVGLWLSYLKGDLAMVGSLLITLVLSSVDDAELDERRALLLQFRGHLKVLTELHEQSESFEFSRLPFRRLNLIMEELFGEDEMNVDFVTTPSSLFSAVGV
ncbi:uncharacterized protein JN550_011081 [Neoarthrinium moseri]|uniref:uncharacterized protein n=1 Tax=Neoarthrinium moseri TaxID=1658444 RepID=UPI001FDCD006|nr:uncharacterized protein JN550_011081 [Neoarthrinium moseri]KAI1860926.1 hypothetical protein JN550_011081 [Neoarthrinium moseri]